MLFIVIQHVQNQVSHPHHSTSAQAESRVRSRYKPVRFRIKRPASAPRWVKTPIAGWWKKWMRTGGTPMTCLKPPFQNFTTRQLIDIYYILYIILDPQLILNDIFGLSVREKVQTQKNARIKIWTHVVRWEWPVFFALVCGYLRSFCGYLCSNQKTNEFRMLDCPACKCPKNARIWNFRSDLELRYQIRKSVSNRGEA